MKTRILVSVLLFGGLLLPQPVMRADITHGDYEPAISVAINNIVRHEKRFLSTSDIFVIHFSPERNLLVVEPKGYDEHYNHYLAIVSPKDTTVKPEYLRDEMKLVWVSPVSKDTIMTCTDCFDWYSENYSLSFSPEEVLIDYSDLPNKMITSAGKLFFWSDEAEPQSKEIIDKLLVMGRVDFLVHENAIGWGGINDGKEVVCYDLEALIKGKIKKYHDYGLWGKGFRARLRQGWYDLWHPQRD
ncbi:MAG: hypothetical protein II858_08650 [Bacteroidales bacterium]|jgi:hypothetical protein|nr:hypothetical protein [Bacteroidales bacterium]